VRPVGKMGLMGQIGEIGNDGIGGIAAIVGEVGLQILIAGSSCAGRLTMDSRIPTPENRWKAASVVEPGKARRLRVAMGNMGRVENKQEAA
jgi:hypothetical protein